jgi:16S rRNA (uracil1498-N3)-methyltransferase
MTLVPPSRFVPTWKETGQNPKPKLFFLTFVFLKRKHDSMNLFYAPDITLPVFQLNAEESKHIIKVLRMKAGDPIFFTDGKGFLYRCRIAGALPKGALVEVLEKEAGKDRRGFYLQMAVAPTKNISRYEWFLEKATEIGVDRITPFISAHSERKTIKPERLNRVITAAMKQSLKTFHPVLDESVPFQELIQQPFKGKKFIAYIDPKVTLELSKAYTPGQNAFVLIGPEGDFSPEEVEQAKKAGFIPVRLGPSRLRTETAAVAACHTINLLNY